MNLHLRPWSTWRKSSFSGAGQSECVEVAPWGEVRDSKNPDSSFTIPTTSWRYFTVVLKSQ
ncbi:DUF397 domain-containing protein [Kibdelosporangium persicum]|uniref:DUF397 domain-containing protein n=1 Tax=Kibdelosporangium persicum TaxID=2698649 RepID=UPI0015664244|nr:DUF397 domain-containing protein [Kibdelosporangium persicum]